MTPSETLRAWFREHQLQVRKQVVDLTIEMVREKTVNVVPDKLVEHPYLKVRGEEWRVAAIVERELRDAGIAYTTYARRADRPNVIGRLGRDATGRRLMVAAHMDVVPAGDPADWKAVRDPFAPEERDGMLVGRGVLDNKGPLASALVAARAIRTALGEEALCGQLQIAALADEEATGPDGVDYGVGYLLEEKLLDATHAIVPDIGEFMKSIDIAEKGHGVLRVTAKGAQAHGSTPERGINAILKMASLLVRLEPFPWIYEEHPVLGHPSLNVGQISGGAASNIVPGSCCISMDVRLVPGQSMEQIRHQVLELAGQIADDFVVEIVDERLPHAIEPNNVLVRAIQCASEPVLGFRPVPVGLGGGTFAKRLNLAGIPAVGWGPGDDDAFHVTDESIAIDELVKFAEVVGLVALELVGD